jgi:hypothetical protein
VRSTFIGATCVALALCATAADAEGAGNDRIIVTTVRIFVNDTRYDWKDGGSMPARAEGGYTEPSTVAMFLGVRPGEEMSADDLERQRTRAEERLLECGYFFTAQVLVVPSSVRADGRMLVAKVREGFLWRFGGGAYYASIGMENVFGAAKSWTAYAGYDRNGISWRDDAVFGGPFGYEAGLFYLNALGTGFLDYHRFLLSLSAGVRVLPDLVLSLKSPVSCRLFLPAGSPAMALFAETADGWEWAPEAAYSWKTTMHPAGTRLSLSGEGSAGITLCSTGAACWRAEGGGRLGLELWPALHLGASGGAAIPIARALPVFSLFDLAGTPDRSIRAGYAGEELLSAAYVMARAELRFPLPRIPLGSLFSVVLAPFLFGDAALAQASSGGAFRDFEGFGLGTRIELDNPVFAYFSLSYGWNPMGSGRFCFSAASSAQ